MIYWYEEEHICTAPKKISYFFLTLFYPDLISRFRQQLHCQISGCYRGWKKGLKKLSILSCRCVNLLMLVSCKLYWCESLVNCTELVNTGFYFVFWAKSAILSNRRRKKQWNKKNNDEIEVRLSTLFSIKRFIWKVTF